MKEDFGKLYYYRFKTAIDCLGNEAKGLRFVIPVQLQTSEWFCLAMDTFGDHINKIPTLSRFFKEKERLVMPFKALRIRIMDLEDLEEVDCPPFHPQTIKAWLSYHDELRADLRGVFGTDKIIHTW